MRAASHIQSEYYSLSDTETILVKIENKEKRNERSEQYTSTTPAWKTTAKYTDETPQWFTSEFWFCHIFFFFHRCLFAFALIRGVEIQSLPKSSDYRIDLRSVAASISDVVFPVCC